MPIGPIFRPLLDVARERGVDIERLLRSAKLSEAALRDPRSRISPERSRAFLRALLDATGDPALGLRAAERFELADADLLGYLAREATQPIAILEAVARFARLLGDSAACRVERRGERVVFVLARSGPRMLPAAADFHLAAIVLLLRRRSRGEVSPSLVTLLGAPPEDPAYYERVFGCPIAFAGDEATLVFTEAPLRAPLPDGDARLGELLEGGAVEALARLPASAFLERALAILSERLEEGSASRCSPAGSR